MTTFNVIILPREVCTWDRFCEGKTHAIALDGYVAGGPEWDSKRKLVNFDHHDGVVREATMSTAKQVYFALKGGFCEWMGPKCDVYVNDIDQDTAMAIWILQNHHVFEGSASVPTISRILELNDRLDITGGAFPMNLSDSVYGTHCWIFEPYTNARRKGAIARADTEDMTVILDAICKRLTMLMMNQAGWVAPDVDVKILYRDSAITVLDERTGGIESRHLAFAQNLIPRTYLSLVADRDDGRRVYTLGKRSRYVDLPLRDVFARLNHVEGFTSPRGWGGSDLIGGSDRTDGSGLSWEQILKHLG